MCTRTSISTHTNTYTHPTQAHHAYTQTPIPHTTHSPHQPSPPPTGALVGLVAEALDGLPVIQAFNKQAYFLQLAAHKTDANHRVVFACESLNLWLAFWYALWGCSFLCVRACMQKVCVKSVCKGMYKKCVVVHTFLCVLCTTPPPHNTTTS